MKEAAEREQLCCFIRYFIRHIRKQNYMYFFVVKESFQKKKKKSKKINMLIVNLLILQSIQKSIKQNTVSLVSIVVLYVFFLWQRLLMYSK